MVCLRTTSKLCIIDFIVPKKIKPQVLILFCHFAAGMTHEGVHSECETCEDNDGMCYLDGNADVKCRCTASKSGDNCEFTNGELHGSN